MNGWLVLADVQPDDARTQVLLDFAVAVTSVAERVASGATDPITPEVIWDLARDSGIHIEEKA